MKIKKIILKNIRSYEDQEVTFPEGTVLLSGTVGSGKTSLLLAVEYALFGLQAGQKGSALIRNEAEDAAVTLECEIEGQEIIVERGLKRDVKSVTSDFAAITHKGKRIECSTTELKTRILDILGYPSEFVKRNNLLYKYTVYTPQEQMKQIILEDSDTRFSVLRHIFGIDKYKVIHENALRISAQLKDEIKTVQAEVRLIEQDKALYESVQQRIKIVAESKIITEKKLEEKMLIRKKLEQEAKEIEKQIREKERLEKEIEKTKILTSSKREALAILEKEEYELKKNLSEANVSFDEKKHTSLLDALKERKHTLEILNEDYIKMVSSLHTLDSFFNELVDKKERIFMIQICPTCLQDVPPAHKHNILNDTEKRLAELKKQHTVLEAKRTKIQAELSKERDLLSKLEQESTAYEIIRSKQTFLMQTSKKIEEVMKLQKTLTQDLDLLQKHLLSLKEQIFKLAPFDIRYKRKAEELKKSFVEEKHAEIERAELNTEVMLLQQEAVRLQELLRTREEARKQLTKLTDLNDWLSNQFLVLVSFIEKQVMLKLRVEFSRLFSTWFTMIGGDAFIVQLDENFTPIIIQGGVEMEYAFLSGGERTAVALAYRLALNQTINSVHSSIRTKDIIILDEPTEGFSEAQIDKMRDILEQLKVKQLILVSHEPKIESFVDHILRVKKEGNTSHIELIQANHKP